MFVGCTRRKLQTVLAFLRSQRQSLADGPASGSKKRSSAATAERGCAVNRGLRNSMTRKRLIGFIVVIQSILCVTHLLLYETWTFSPVGRAIPGAFWIKLVLGFLSGSFVVASLLAFRYSNAALRGFYRIAAVWMGMLSFLFLAAVFAWTIFGVARLVGLDVNFHRTVELLYGAAVV